MDRGERQLNLSAANPSPSLIKKFQDFYDQNDRYQICSYRPQDTIYVNKPPKTVPIVDPPCVQSQQAKASATKKSISSELSILAIISMGLIRKFL